MEPNPKQHEESAAQNGGAEKSGADVLAAMPSYGEHMKDKSETGAADTREMGRSIMETMNATEINAEKEKSPEERQVEDLEVLFSFCDGKEALDILKSDAYGTLLKNKVSLVDLFNADALFSEQYYDDGYTKEYDERTYGDKLENFIQSHQKNVERNMDFIGYLERKGDFEYADKVRSGGAGYLIEDLARAREARRTIEEVAGFIENGDWGKMADVVKVRAEGGELSDEQKEYLANEWGTVPERLLYGGKVVNEERAGNILRTLNGCEDEFSEDLNSENESTRNQAEANLVTRFVYAEGAIRDFEQAGRLDLIADARKKLEELVDTHFDEIARFRVGSQSDDYDFGAKERLILNYSDPYKLAGRLMSWGIRDGEGNEHGGTLEDSAAIHIENPDAIVDAMTREFNNGDITTIYISKWAKQLKALGVSDEAILAKCSDLRPHNFVSVTSAPDGSGARLVEAGIDRKKIIKEVFSTYWREDNPFDNGDPLYRGESEVEVLERNGFDITDIAKTYAPNTISKHLNEFLTRGADAKALTEYMLSYHETFDGNIARDKNGNATGAVYHMGFEGIQKMVVRDNEHPDGRILLKEGAPGRGIDYVAANLNTLADHGVTGEFIMNKMDASAAEPQGHLMAKMLECSKFDTKQVLAIGLNRYREYLKEMDKWWSKAYIEHASDARNYYAELVDSMSAAGREQRDKYFKALA